MPTYSYACRGCAHQFDERQGILEDPLATCPSCGESLLYRKVTAGGGVLFKGTGFYQTDYKPQPKAPEEGA